MSAQPRILIYSNKRCTYCAAARMMFTKKGLRFDEIEISGDDDVRKEMERLTGSRSIPQIFINDQLVGGFDELCALDKSGDLEKLLEC